MIKKTIFTTLLVLAGSAVNAGSLQLHGASVHFEPRPSGKWNERNIGLGYRFDSAGPLRAQVGIFQNSVDRTTAYAIADFMPLQYKAVRAGVFAGVGTGYDGPFLGGFAADVALSPRVTLTVRLIPRIQGVAPATAAFEIGITR